MNEAKPSAFPLTPREEEFVEKVRERLPLVEVEVVDVPVTAHQDRPTIRFRHEGRRYDVVRASLRPVPDLDAAADVALRMLSLPPEAR